MDLLSELARYFGPGGETRRVVLLGCTLLGISSGVLGSFAFLRRQSLLGDAMAHSALPGVCAAFLISGVKNPVYFLIGALLSGLLGAWLISVITSRSRIKNDSAIGLILSVFFGVGIVLLTVVQQSGSGNQAGLDTFLFGKAAFLLRSDIYLIAGLGLALLSLVWLFFKEFKILSFDPDFAATLGYSTRRLDLLLTGLVVVAVMVGLQAVGVILMAALLIMPAAAARQWTDRLSVMLWIAGATGAIAGASGALISTLVPKTPTGPVMVLTAAAIMLFSLFVAPRRGLIPSWIRRYRSRNKIERENLLKAIYRLGEDRDNFEEPISPGELRDQLMYSEILLGARCRRLGRAGLLESRGPGWILTPVGLHRAREVVRNHRLWELYLTRQADIAADHVHRDAEEMEHLLTPEIVEQLVQLLDQPGVDPHGRPIPAIGPVSGSREVADG